MEELAQEKKALNLPEPDPCVALIMADGDRMGKLLSTASTLVEHQLMASALQQFADSVPHWIRTSESNPDEPFNGHCIYSGGDDVLALVPADRALGCAAQLRDKFAQAMNDLIEKLQKHRTKAGLPSVPLPVPTLSAGIAIQHCNEPLGRLRQLAAQAEKTAKQGDDDFNPRDAVFLSVNPRSGRPLRVGCNWQSTHA